MAKSKKPALTTPDLVLLSLLAEGPMHGYQANLELERRQVRDWAGISRPQIYYSLEKLEKLGLIRTSTSDVAGAGPERNIFATNAKGRTALANALEEEHWSLQRERPPFLTWLALSWQASPPVFRKQLQRRREFLARELEREEETLRGVRLEVGHDFHEAVWMLTLVLDQLRTEIKWLDKLQREAGKRAPAKRANIVSAEAT
jgi:DNA-binding PadR family transcriptional regulator